MDLRSAPIAGLLSRRLQLVQSTRRVYVAGQGAAVRDRPAGDFQGHGLLARLRLRHDVPVSIRLPQSPRLRRGDCRVSLIAFPSPPATVVYF